MNGRRLGLEVLLAAVGGVAALLVPVLLDPHARQHEAAFLPVMGNAVEGMHPSSLALLFLVGMLLGWVAKAPALLIGPATMLAFPVWSILDMAAGGDHNLFPIEWSLYVVFSMFGLAGVAAARVVRKWAAAS